MSSVPISGPFASVFLPLFKSQTESPAPLSGGAYPAQEGAQAPGAFTIGMGSGTKNGGAGAMPAPFSSAAAASNSVSFQGFGPSGVRLPLLSIQRGLFSLLSWL